MFNCYIYIQENIFENLSVIIKPFVSLQKVCSFCCHLAVTQYYCISILHKPFFIVKIYDHSILTMKKGNIVAISKFCCFVVFLAELATLVQPIAWLMGGTICLADQ